MLTRASLAILLITAALVGCVRDDPPAEDGTTTTTTAPTGTTPTSTTPTTPTTGPNATKPANPAPVTEKGAISGPFEKSWPIQVPAVAPKAVTILFNLTGVQPGAPVTASVFLALKDPDGKVVKSANIGLGGTGDKVNWALSAADIVAVGAYTLSATARSDTPQPIPSGGLANYELTATVEY